MYTRALNILLLTSTMFLVGCGGSDDNSATELEGMWAESCQSDSSDNTSSKLEVTFSGNDWNATFKGYSDLSCSILAGEELDSGTFVIGNAMTSDSGLSGKNLDVTTLVEDNVEVAEGDVAYNIFRLVDGSLFFGEESEVNDGSTSAKRPTEFDFTNFLTKI